MNYAAYQSRRDSAELSFAERDEAAGILGRHIPGAAQPIATADTLEELRREAYAYLGKEPECLLYLVDPDCFVRDIIINQKHHAAVKVMSLRLTIAVAVLVFCVTCLLGASLGLAGGLSLFIFVVAVVSYAVLLRVGPLNEIESAVLCEMLLVAALIPALLRRGTVTSKQSTGAGLSANTTIRNERPADSGGSR